MKYSNNLLTYFHECTQIYNYKKVRPNCIEARVHEPVFKKLIIIFRKFQRNPSAVSTRVTKVSKTYSAKIKNKIILLCVVKL